MDIKELKSKIVKFLDEKKTENIVEIDTSTFNSRLSDVCIIASGTSSRHMQSVAENLCRILKEDKCHPKIEGTASSGWVLIETNGIEVHLFKPTLRSYYDIESLLRSGSTPKTVRENEK